MKITLFMSNKLLHLLPYFPKTLKATQISRDFYKEINARTE